jgi:hypothetical protein
MYSRSLDERRAQWLLKIRTILAANSKCEASRDFPIQQLSPSVETRHLGLHFLNNYGGNDNHLPGNNEMRLNSKTALGLKATAY